MSTGTRITTKFNPFIQTVMLSLLCEARYKPILINIERHRMTSSHGATINAAIARRNEFISTVRKSWMQMITCGCFVCIFGLFWCLLTNDPFEWNRLIHEISHSDSHHHNHHQLETFFFWALFWVCLHNYTHSVTHSVTPLFCKCAVKRQNIACKLWTNACGTHRLE